MSTTLEDCVERLGAVPQDIRRYMDLIKDLDRQWTDRFGQLKHAQGAYVDHVRAALKGKPRDGSVDLRSSTENTEAMNQIRVLRKDCQQLAEEKVTIAQQAYELVDTHIQKLDGDLVAFEEALRRAGQMGQSRRDNDDGMIDYADDGSDNGWNEEAQAAYRAPSRKSQGQGSYGQQGQSFRPSGGGGRAGAVGGGLNLGLGQSGFMGLGGPGGVGLGMPMPSSSQQQQQQVTGQQATGGASAYKQSSGRPQQQQQRNDGYGASAGGVGADSDMAGNTGPVGPGTPYAAATAQGGGASAGHHPGMSPPASASGGPLDTPGFGSGAGGPMQQLQQAQQQVPHPAMSAAVSQQQQQQQQQRAPAGFAYPQGGAAGSGGGGGGGGAQHHMQQSAQGRGGSRGQQQQFGGEGLHDYIAEENTASASEPTYCVCNRPSYGEMVGCDNDNCAIEWFHMGCVGLTAAPKGKWYCPECRPIVAGGGATKRRR